MANSGIKVHVGDLVVNEHDAAAGVDGLYIDGTKVVGTQEAHIADAVVAHDINATFSDTEVEGTLDALGTKINAILTVLENHGLVASS